MLKKIKNIIKPFWRQIPILKILYFRLSRFVYLQKRKKKKKTLYSPEERRLHGIETCKKKKLRFSIKKSAWGKANEIKKRTGINLTVYKCPYCRKFHLTSKSPKNKPPN